MSTRRESSSVVSGIVRPVAIGVGVGAVSCLLLLFAAAAVLASGWLPQAAVMPVAVVILSLAALFGGFAAARSSRERGLLYGVGCGMLLFFITAIAGLDVEQTVQGVSLFLKLALSVGCGALGGIVGVNLKRR